MENGTERKDEKQPKRFERKPRFDMRAKLSRDGRYWIIERVETWILPANYLSAISRNHALEKNQTAAPGADEKPKKKGKRDADSNG
ncbi:MAG: hypothetical protein KF681_00275 [Bdellovibrionaceae bacterium]|nr:hypothetical protein [Pseudobdellovibrionaceae bacterium]